MLLLSFSGPNLVLPINPVLVGAGKRLFADGPPGRAFVLTGTTALPTGIVVCAYTLGDPLQTLAT